MESPFQGTSGVQPHISHQNPYPASQELIIGQNSEMISSGVQEGQTDMDSSLGTLAELDEQKRDGLNLALICRTGEDTVKDIVNKISDLVLLLKTMQLPNGTAQSMSTQEEKKVKVQEYIRGITNGFKKLRRICEKCNENAVTMEYAHTDVGSLIPFEDEVDSRQEEKKQTDFAKSCTAEQRELIEAIMLKNRQLKEVIDNLRSFIWDINTMLYMRNP